GLPVAAGRQHAHHRHDEAVHDRLYQAAERGADDDGERERQDALLDEERLEFAEHREPHGEGESGTAANLRDAVAATRSDIDDVRTYTDLAEYVGELH